MRNMTRAFISQADEDGGLMRLILKEGDAVTYDCKGLSRNQVLAYLVHNNISERYMVDLRTHNPDGTAK